jgi:PAS domain S-box-containing protein
MNPRPWSSVIVAVAFAALLIGLAIINRVNAARVEESAQWVAHTYAVTTELAEMLSTLVDAETGQRGFVITGEERYLQPYQSAVAEVQTHIDRVAALTADNSDQQADIARVRSLAVQKLAELDESIAVRRASGFAAAQQIVATDRGKRMMDDLRVVASRMAAREQALLAAREVEARRSSARARWAAVATTAFAVVAVGAVWFGFRRYALERARATAAIANEREHLRVTLLGLGDGVIVVDASGNISMMNPIAEVLTGWLQPDAIGTPVSQIFNIVNEDTRQPVTNPLKVVLETGTIQGLANHTVLIAADGTERPIDDSAAPIRTTDGSVTGAVLVFRDISSRRAAERRLRDALDEAEANRALAERRQGELEQALDVKNQFLAAVSHELRTPINAILGWATQLRAGTVRPERTASAIVSIERSAHTLARLIEDLLESSRLLAGKVRLETHTIDVLAVIHEAIDALRFTADTKSITIDVQTMALPAIRGDASRLKQVVWNVLGNAIKFTPPGGAVYVRTNLDDGVVRLSIRDTGPGIPASLLPYVFEAFRQGDEQSRTGLGLGLAIARQLVELHGGTIDATNDGSTGGATFVISLPVAVTEVSTSAPRRGNASGFTVE